MIHRSLFGPVFACLQPKLKNSENSGSVFYEFLSLGLIRLASSSLGLMLIYGASAEPFSLGTRTVEIPEAGKVTYTVLSTVQNEIHFLPPQGWKTETDAKAGTLTWTSPDYRSMIRLKVKDDGGDQIPKLQAEELRATVLQELTGAKITEEFPCYTSGGSGLAFDCQRTLDGDYPVATRLAFVPTPGGVAQFNLTAPPEQFARRQMDFSRFLNSFHVESLKPE